jgi:hypothetical protein
MYYPIIINHSQTGTTITDTDGSIYANGAAFSKDSQIAANTSYDLSITIQGRGVSSVSQDITPSSATVTMTVASWTGVTYTNSFTPKKAYIGNYYYNDGSWGTVANPTDGRTTIGIVFSTTTSTTDQAKGWTHGYAMALTNATTSAMWYGGTYASDLTDYTDWTSMKADKDGYTKSQTIKKNKTLSTSSYPAFYYALNYGVINNTSYATSIGTNNSGWYLPSIGQWYDICVNLGGMSATATATGSGYGRWYSGDDSSGKNYSSITATNINSYLTTLSSSGYTVNTFTNSTESYWSASEYNSSAAYNANLESSGNMHLDNGSKSGTNYRVRPVIAF